MTAQGTTTLFHRLVDEVLNPGDFDRADDLIAPDHIDHITPSGQSVVGLAGFKQGAAQVRAAFPDFQATIEDSLTGDDKIAFRLRMRGTHLGTFAGIAPTGKEVNYTAIGFVRVADGKIAERWLQIDATGLLRQLGTNVIPQPPQSPRPK
jgi:steroid delta-isomerase-like uncharacterized protein